MKAANQRARLDPLLEIAGGIAVAAVLVFIGWRIIKGQTTIGDFTGFVTALLLAAQSDADPRQSQCHAAGGVVGFASGSSACSTNRREVGERPGARHSSSLRGEIRFRNVSLRLWRGCRSAARASTITVPGRTR